MPATGTGTMNRLTVSQIARRTGLTVRTLHHYEAKGLLRPAARSDAGYRLYGMRELLRLQHIASLKALGFPLTEIRACLDADAPSLGEALMRQVDRLRASVVRQQHLLSRLEQVALQVSAGETTDAESLLNSIEATTIMDKYFSSEQLQTLQRRADELGPAHIRSVEQAWPDVIAGMRAALELARDPASEEVQALARRWRSLVREFTGGDAEIQRSMNTMFREDAATMQQKTGIDPALMDYARRAIAGLPD